MAIKRADRVSDLIKAELSDILHKEIRDPVIGPVTVTGVKMSNDLRSARVYFVRLGSDINAGEAEQHLQKAAGFLKRELGKRISLRYMPDLIFVYDKSFEYGSRIEKLLAEIRKDGNKDADPDK
ncbi:MAG: 30S ribosome-binding factor RbfA [Syntrophaceae bacterium]